MRKQTARAQALRRNQINAIVLENRIGGITADAYAQFPLLWGNVEVLRLLEYINDNTKDPESEWQSGFGKGEEAGADSGYRQALDEWLPKIDQKFLELKYCIEAEDKKLRAEIPEAIAGIEKLIAKMQEVRE